MTVYYTYIDDTVGAGSSTVAGIQGGGYTHGVYISENINTGIITSTSLETGIITATSISVGVVTATGGFISSASTTPIQINFDSGTNSITFSIAGIGTTSLVLF